MRRDKVFQNQCFGIEGTTFARDAKLCAVPVGRRVAAHHGLVVMGVVGVVLRARRAGLVPSVGQVLEALVTDAKFRLSPDVIEAALRLAGEVD